MNESIKRHVKIICAETIFWMMWILLCESKKSLRSFLVWENNTVGFHGLIFKWQITPILLDFSLNLMPVLKSTPKKWCNIIVGFEVCQPGDNAPICGTKWYQKSWLGLAYQPCVVNKVLFSWHCPNPLWSYCSKKQCDQNAGGPECWVLSYDESSAINSQVNNNHCIPTMETD